MKTVHRKAAGTSNKGMQPVLATALVLGLLVALSAAATFWPHAQPVRALGVGAVSAGGDVAGGGHTCAIGPGLGVKCWGQNQDGQLGNGTTTDSATPVDVSGLTTGVVAVSAGGARASTGTDSYACALTAAGGVKCWGYNFFGQLGNGTFTNSSTPVNVLTLGSGVAAISAGGDHTCALTTAGGVRCWGDNSNGQLGDGQACGLVCALPVNVSGLGSGVLAVSAGASHTCAVTTSNGVKCWGENIDGDLGDGTVATDRITPVDVCASGTWTGIACSGSALTGILAVSAGVYHTCALTTGNGVKCWGDNFNGQLGDGQACSSGPGVCANPVNVSGLSSGVAAVSAGHIHTCALTMAGGAKCWGYNNDGEIGNGTNTNATTPVTVNGLSSGVAAVSAGYRHTCALTTLANVKCWGRNFNGELGDGTTSDSNVPVSVVASVKDSPPPPPCPILNLPLPAAGCTNYTTTTSLIVSAPLLSGSPLACTAPGIAATTRSSVADHAPANSLDDILIDIYFVSGYINCPGPYGSGSSISSGGKIEEQTNLLPGVLEFPATGDFVLCLKVYTTTILGTIENCPVSFATPALKQPLNLHCTFSSLDSASCNVVGPSRFYDDSELKQEKAKVTDGGMDLSPFVQQGPVGGVGFSPQTPAASGSRAGLLAALGVGAVLLALAGGALLARRRGV